MLLFLLSWLGISLYLRSRKKKDYIYLLFFTVFFVYIYKVLDYTLFQFQSLLLLKVFMPGLLLKGQTADRTLNLIPLITLTSQDIETSLLNILLFIPFGFGLPFITALRLRKTIAIGALFSICIELLQLLTGLAAHITFRVADINDVLFNTSGVVMGYLLFLTFIRIFLRVYNKQKKVGNAVLRYIADRPHIHA